MTRFLVIAVALLSAAFLLWAGQSLPENVASHFNSDGVADSTMPRPWFMVVMLAVASVMPPVVWMLQARNSRLGRTRIAHPEYWYDERRRASTVATLEAHAAVLMLALSAFLCFVFWLLVQAHRAVGPAPVLDKPLFLLGLGVFVVFAAGWVVLLKLHFRKRG